MDGALVRCEQPGGGTGFGRPYRMAGRSFDESDVIAVATVVATGLGLSRHQLAVRVCERLEWRRPTGALKWRECRDLLELLERDGRLTLPAKRGGRTPGARTRTPMTNAGEPGEALVGPVGAFEPVAVEPVARAVDHRLFRELVGRYHYLGYRMPYGAHLRYLLFAGQPRRVVGAFQVSSPAWRLAARDRWIGWDDRTRSKNLQRVVNNSRFVLLPWVRVSNLASRALSLLVRRLPGDWSARFAVEPLLVETLVDESRYRGTCYRAANWLDLGVTAGRGRMDRFHAAHGRAPKRVLVYPLSFDAAERLARTDE